MRVVLGVSGSVAAYRAADLARDLMRAGFEVRVCLTDSAQKFVSSALFEALTGHPCLVDTFEEPVRGRMAHIDWARSADALLIAPATANTINRLAAGIGDDMLTTIALAYDGLLMVAPAMNPTMFASDSVRNSLATLSRRGAEIVEPTEGDVACGENGQGKLASNSVIVERVTGLTKRRRILAGKSVLITSGPTVEPIDDVRFLSNHSSGKMGAALARATILLGGSAHVVSGPTSIPLPVTATTVKVQTAGEMLEASLPLATKADIVVGCAAVADYRPAARMTGKIRRSEESLSLNLVPNPDVIAEIAKVSPGMVIGFAAEPSGNQEVALLKLKSKGLHAIASNDVSRSDIGFSSDDNELTLLFADGRVTRSGKRSKLNCALWLFESLVSSGQIS